MSSSVESRIVTMKFDNTAFEKGAATTLGTLGKLKEALSNSFVGKGISGLGSSISGVFSKLNSTNPFSGWLKGISNVGGAFGSLLGKLGIGVKDPFVAPQQGLSDLQSKANSFSLSTMEGGITHVSGSWLALTTVALTALSTITQKAISEGSRLAKGFTLQPLIDGFHEYETKIGSTQTILANTSKFGTTLHEVNSALNDLNHYADKTIYSFGDMTKNIGLFTNAGIRVEDATSMIKGFSNVAAASGTNAQGAASAAYQLSQALSAGTVRLMDWRSLQNVGMGNANMKQGIVDIADAMGTLDKSGTSSKEVMKNFNGSLEKGWLSADVMSKYLKIMAGDMTVAQMKTMGLSDAQIKTFQTNQKNAQEAATKVRTFTQLIGTMKEAVGSGWSRTFELILGNFNSATDLFTGINNVVGGFVNHMSNARNRLLKDWKDLGGRTELIEGLKNAWGALVDVVTPIKEAFRDIFPKETAKDLFQLTKSFRKFTEDLTIGDTTANNVYRTFKGFFAVFDIGWQIVKGIIGIFGDLFSTMSKGSGGFLSFTGGVGDMLVALDDAIKKGGLLKGFFHGLEAVLSAPLHIIQLLAGALSSLFDGFSKADGAGKAISRINERLSPLAALGRGLQGIWSAVQQAFSKVLNFVQPLMQGIADAFSHLGEMIANSLQNGGFSKVLDVINTGLIAAIVLMLKHFVSGDLVNIDLGGGLVGSIKSTFGELTTTLKSMQQQIKADTLIKIAIAIGLITASIVALSFIDSKALTRSLVGVSVGMGVLGGALVTLSRMISGFGTLKIVPITTAMILLATSVLILSTAVAILGRMSWEQLARGMAGMIGIMVVLIALAKPLSAASKGMIRSGAGMIVMAAGLEAMAVAVVTFAKMKWDTIIHGLGGIAAAMVTIAAAMRLMPKGMALQAAALIGIGVALNIVARAISIIGSMKTGDLVRGLLGIAGALAIIAVAMDAMPLTMIVTAAALVVTATALTILAGAVKIMASMGWEEIGKGMVVLAGSLTILAIAMDAMLTGLPGAAALVVAAAALAILAPVLVALGALSWEAILKGLAALAGVFVILGVAGVLLGPVVPIIAALAISILAIGAGMALAGLGALAFATAFALVVTAVSAGTAVITGLLGALIQKIPPTFHALAMGIVNFAKTIGQHAHDFGAAFGHILATVINTLIKYIPRIGQVFIKYIETAARVIIHEAPAIVRAGIAIIMALLNAINKNVTKITPIAISIIVKFINSLAKNIGKVQDAAANLIIKFIQGAAKAVNNHSAEMGRAGGELAWALAKGMVVGLANAQGYLAGKAWDVAKGMLHSAMKALGVASPSKEFAKVGMWSAMGLAQGLDDHAHIANRSAENMAHGALAVVRASMAKAGDAIDQHMDLSPRITPILDLTQLQNEATKIGAMVGNHHRVNVDLPHRQASDISAAHEAILAAAEASKGDEGPREVTFVQNNHSPKALSSVEIYRNTRSQISQAKEALGSGR